jgi:uncharacterized membrane protein YeaQ/YmgE (transglycosylase-associated protein family)
MSLQAMVVLVAVGLIAGWLGSVAMKVGGYGLKRDVMLGIGGSMAGGGLFHLFASAADAGWLTMIVGAFLGAALVLVVQRMFWQVRPAPSRSKR